ncbi:hypothetical protein [Acinetobacter pittii]|uniref:hypothetical protein n=1 Tax=Acinetobacter pittii TaxID=48296 RepID=UPI001D197D45|nr:hypothetical protein [Acinetobacter pittii]
MAVPDKDALIGPTVTEAQFKTNLGEIVDFIKPIESQSPNYATTALLTASRPIENQSYAKALDTGEVWHWNKPAGSPDGNYWTSTGLSEYGRAITYSDNRLLEKVLAFYSVTSNNFNIINVNDAERNSIFRIDENGDFHIFGQQLSIQENFKEIFNEIIKLQIVNEISKLISSKDNASVIRLNDGQGNPLLRIEENTELFLYGETESVQAKFQRIFSDLTEFIGEGSSLNKKDSIDIVRITDSAGNPLLRFDENTEAYFYGYAESIQSMLKKINVQPEVVKPLRALNSDYLDKKFLFNDGFIERLNNAKAMHLFTAPVPTFMNFQKFSINNNWVNEVTLNVLNPDDRVQMSGYQPVFNEDIGVVHPQIWVFNEAVAGYKYWLSINPYTNGNEKIELPFIYGSNDPEFRSWELIPNFPTPFEQDPIDIPTVFRGHLSDSGFTFDVKTGELIFFWRKNIYHLDGSHPDQIGVQGSRFNGKEWSESHQIYGLRSNPDDGVTEGLMSPNIVYNPANDLYYMYSTQDGKLWYRTSPDITGDYWSNRTECILNHHSGSFWHLDAKFVGDKLVILIHQDNFMSSSTDALYFAISSDFVNFNVSENSILTDVDPPIYKATFQPIFTSENTAKFRVIYTSDARTTPQYQMYVTDTNEFNIGV